MKLRLLVNPTASALSDGTAEAVRRTLAADHTVEVVTTRDRGHAVDLAREAAAEGVEAVVVLGGDGTANEVANGLVGTSTALAPLPAGSTNVFARTIGLPNDVDEAAEQLRRALAANSIRRIGLGSVNDRYFLFHTGLGFDAAVVEQVERRSSLKRRIGQAVFVFAAVATWVRHYDRSRPHLRLEYDDKVVDDGYFAICLNSNPYTYLGPRPLNLAPDAGKDGSVAVVTFRTAAFFTVLRLIGSAVVTGRALRSHPLVDYRPRVAEATVTGYGEFPYQVDGDFVGDTDQIRLRHHPRALAIVFPPGHGPEGGSNHEA